MQSERWRQIQSIFHSMLACAPERREAYLDEACQSDATLRREIVDLLTAYERSCDPLDMPALEDGLNLLDTRPALVPGDRLGRYEILASVGAGGMGEVYVARDPQLARKVAIKVLPAAFANNMDRVRRLHREGRAVSALNHPNILTIYDIGESHGRHYLATEFVQGITLRSRLLHGPLSPEQATRIGRQVAVALEAAHAAGVVHRDIKPENLILRPDGLLKVLDFGIAKVLRPAGPIVSSGPEPTLETERGQIAGSACYMSPEQVVGEELDCRTDLWSLGIILYEMLAGKTPFSQPTRSQIALAIINKDPPRLPSDVPANIADLVYKALAKDRDARYRSATDLLNDLEEAQSKGKTEAVPKRSLRWPRSFAEGRRPYLLSALSLLVVLAGTLAYLANHFTFGSPGAPSFQYLTYSGRDFSPAASPSGRTIAFTSDRDGQPRIWLKQMTDGIEVPLTTGPDDFPRFSPDGSAVLFIRRHGSETSLFTIPVVGGPPRRLMGDVVGADFSPDGREIAVVRWQTSPAFTGSIVGVLRIDAPDGVKERARVPLRQLYMPRWSPDGEHIATLHSIGAFGSEIVVIGRDGSVRVLDPKTELAISGPVWVHSHNDLVYVRGDYAASSKADLVRHSLQSGNIDPLHTEWSRHSRCVDITADGRVIFDTSSRRSNLREIPVKGGKGKWLTRGTSMDRQPVFSPDGKRLAFTSDRSGGTDIWQLELDTNEITNLTQHPSDDMDPAYTPDGKEIIWTSNRNGHLEIYMADRDGGQVRRVTNDGVDAQNATMTADGRWIVYTSSHPSNKGIWKIHPDGSGGAERIASGVYFNPEVSPSGKYALYIASAQPAINVIRVLSIEDGAHVPFEIRCEIRNPTQVVIGRARWGRDDRTILFTGQDETGIHGIFEQPFTPGKDTHALRRRFAAFDPDTTTESFGISPSGNVVVAKWHQLWSVMVADRIPGIQRRKRIL